MEDVINGRATEDLLNSISRRLSGREDCKGLTYTITIDHLGVRMYPLIYVFPNRYNKKETDKLDVVRWAHTYKFPDIQLSDLVFGRYQYRQDGESKKRRWTTL